MHTRTFYRHPIGNPRRAWRQDRFILSTFRGVTGDVRTGFENLKRAGFNLLEFGWVPSEYTDRAVAIAEEVGIDVLVQDWRHFGGFQESRSRDIDMDDIKAYIDNCKKYKHIYGYYVWDEPYFQADVEKAARQTNIIASLDPERMPFSVAIPSYNREYTYQNGLFDDYMERFVTTIDPPVMSLDYYPFPSQPKNDTQLDDCGIYKDLYLMRKWSLARSLPLWFYYQGTEELGPCTMTPTQMHMHANIALLYGAKALQQYTAVGSVIRRDGTPDVYFDTQKRLNERVKNWGRTLMALTSLGVYHSGDVLASDPDFRSRYCDPISSSRVFAADLPRRVSAGEFTDEYGHLYVMILNRDYTAAQDVTLPLKKDMRVYEVSPDSGDHALLTDKCASLSLSLGRGEARLLRLQDPSEEPYLVEYLLQK